jgi:hypothetical protein
MGGDGWLLKKDPETERQHEETRLRNQQAAEEERRRKEAEAAEAAFWATAGKSSAHSAESSYAGLVEHHLIPAIGAGRLQALDV